MAHQQAGGPLVPIISVTPHSPGSKHYPILEDNLQQLHDIHESIQQMREHSAQAFNHQMLRLNQYSRLSASCPSLNNEPGAEPDLLGSVNSSPTQLPGSLYSSTHTTPQAGPPPTFRANSKELLMARNGDDPKRRRSWTALGDGTNGQEKRKTERQRSSMSLSSMDSDQDDPFLDQSEGTNGSVFLSTSDGAKLVGSAGNVKTRRYSGTTSPVSCSTWNSGGASTHSLNEADLQSDFNKIVAKREAENLRLLPARLPLQKSVSTPSIIAVRDIVSDVIGASIPVVVESAEPLHATIQSLIDGHDGGLQRPSGTESETEEEVTGGDLIGRGRVVGLPVTHFPHPPNNHLSFDEFLTDSTAFDAQEVKRRKRGSIFFRKKKDKTKKVVHQWVSVSYGSPHICDWCSKALTNKPALFCETCTVTVHQSSCKDHILECNKPKPSKSNLGKVTGGLGSHLQGLQGKTQGKRGSGSLQANQTSSSSGSSRRNTCYSQWRRVATKLGVKIPDDPLSPEKPELCKNNGPQDAATPPPFSDDPKSKFQWAKGFLANQDQIINEEKEADHHHHHHHGHHDNFSDDVPLVPLEFLDESPITAHDLETDPFLGLHEEEPDSWTPTVGKEVTKKLKEKEIKRQEHIYEFILTEKHHCLTLRVMQKVFVDGLQRYFNMGHNLDRMFPRLADLTEIHLSFLRKLRERQKSRAPVLDSIADILLEQFSGAEAEKLKSAYGEFCSRHRDAVDLYKDYLQHDRRFGEFVRHCQTNPLLKKKGIPECVLFVTQRLTKYPLLIEPLIKTAKDNKPEQEKLARALALVKEILVEVDAQVAEKEKEDRKLEIYNRIDAKSFTVHRDQKFKKSDILSANRRLRFEGVATLMQGRSKMQVVLVIVLSDVLFFLQENNHKYTFFTPDNKAGVVSLQKLLVREKAGQESRGIYLISSNPADPEMFELKVHKPKDKHAWISAVRAAVQQCPEEEEEAHALSTEEKRRLLEAKHSQIQQIVGVLRQKDVEQALILEEKMALQLKLLAASGLGNLPEPPSYTHLVSEDADSNTMWKEVLSAFHEVNQLASSLYASGTNLSRSVSSVGEHQSEAYVSPTLPKRAETFGGYDNANKEQLQAFLNKALAKKQAAGGDHSCHSCHSTPVSTPESEAAARAAHKLSSERVPPWRNALLATVPPGVLGPPSLGETSSGELPPLLTLGQEQQMAAVRLSHYVYTLLCIISQQMTTIDSLQASLSASKQQQRQEDGRERRPMYRHNQQLEELRNLQDRLSHEKEAWTRDRETEERDIEEQRTELLRLQEQVRSEQADITQQREQLYRRMEMLTSQGILISPNMPVVTAGTGQEETETPATSLTSPSPPTDNRRKSDNKWKPPPIGGPTPPGSANSGSMAAATGKPLPLNLISATNQQKAAAQSVQVKQQLPLKLAKLGGGGTVTGPSREGVTQMLPLKLSQMESLSNRKDRSSPQPGSYQRLSSNSFSPSTAAAAREETTCQGATPTHVRTGSSPAMMQPHASPGQLPGVSGATALHTYPRLPADKLPRSTNPDTHQHSQPTPPDTRPQHKAPRATEEEVIFF